MKSTFSLSVLLALFFLSAAVSVQASSCVSCHTSDTVMKSLYKPPVVTTGEEGEG